jgi:hypothetical protein
LSGLFRGSGNVFVGFLDFGEGVGDVVFVVDVFRTDFKGTSTALEVSVNRFEVEYSKDKVDHFGHCGGLVIFVTFNPF